MFMLAPLCSSLPIGCSTQGFLVYRLVTIVTHAPQLDLTSLHHFSASHLTTFVIIKPSAGEHVLDACERKLRKLSLRGGSLQQHDLITFCSHKLSTIINITKDSFKKKKKKKNYCDFVSIECNDKWHWVVLLTVITWVSQIQLCHDMKKSVGKGSFV